MADIKYVPGKNITRHSSEAAARNGSLSKKKPEKVWGFTLASFLGLLGIFVVKYLVDFLLLPAIFPNLYPASTGAIILWFITSILFTLGAMLWVTRFGYFYPVAIALYSILVALIPLGLYGTAAVPAIAIALVAFAVLCVIYRALLWIFILVGFITM